MTYSTDILASIIRGPMALRSPMFDSRINYLAFNYWFIYTTFVNPTTINNSKPLLSSLIKRRCYVEMLPGKDV